ASAIALVEDQIHDGEDGLEALMEQVWRGHAKWNSRFFDLPLFSHQTLRHGAFRDEKGAGNLVGGKAAEGTQGERDLCFDGESRMTAGEEQFQSLVTKHRGI